MRYLLKNKTGRLIECAQLYQKGVSNMLMEVICMQNVFIKINFQPKMIELWPPGGA